jgi:hypothetical protein
MIAKREKSWSSAAIPPFAWHEKQRRSRIGTTSRVNDGDGSTQPVGLLRAQTARLEDTKGVADSAVAGARTVAQAASATRTGTTTNRADDRPMVPILTLGAERELRWPGAFPQRA